MSWWWVLLVALVVVLLAFWLSWTASRLDRIHHRIQVARGGTSMSSNRSTAIEYTSSLENGAA